MLNLSNQSLNIFSSSGNHRNAILDFSCAIGVNGNCPYRQSSRFYTEDSVIPQSTECSLLSNGPKTQLILKYFEIEMDNSKTEPE